MQRSSGYANIFPIIWHNRCYIGSGIDKKIYLAT